MSHSFLALDMSLIPQATKDNVPTFWSGYFNNDNSYMLIDGYNDKRELVHPQATLSAWLQWESNPQETQEIIIANAIEYTKDEFMTLKNDINSIWYIEEVIE